MRALIPTFILDRYKENRANGVIQGAALFVDLSGFSTMADVLSKQGHIGAEILTDIMRVVFGPLVNAVYEQGGFVVGYAGDAFTALFPADQSPADAVKRCLSSALAMQLHVQENPHVQTAFGNFPISIKAGMGFGETTWQIFKSRDGAHATFWFRGESITGAVQGEKFARPGQVIADPAAYQLLQGFVTAQEIGPCFQILAANVDLPAPHPVSAPQVDSDLIGIFLSEKVANLPIVGEFRQVVNLFIDIPIHITDEALITPFMETVYALQDRYGGFFLRPDLGDKGFNLLMFWGAPVAHENDVMRALNFLLELSEHTQLDLRAGISYYVGYAGFMGSALREDYTSYGWGVNLAARLMENAAAGSFWMDEEITRRAEKNFKIEYLDEFKFKGFTQKQKAFALLGRKELAETVYQGQLLGRSTEMQALADFAEPLKTGKFAGVMVLKGEAGIGKSRLTHAFQISEYFQQFHARWVVCQSNDILRQSFNPFMDWLRKRFDLLDGDTDANNWVRFTNQLDTLIKNTPNQELAAELTRTSSVLAALINITVPDSLYEQLEAKSRYENTLIALGALLRAESLQTPLVLFMEDTHWLDEDTGAFLSYFVRTLLAEPSKEYPIAIIATQRLEGDSVKLMDEVAMHEIKLGGLSSASTSGLAEDILGKPVSSSLVQLLDQRADGNPFFVEQIIRYLHEQGDLVLQKDGKYYASKQAQTSMPADIQSVLIARLDSLAQHVRDAVQTASILGREFEVRLLAQILTDDPELIKNVNNAEQANIWAPLNELEYFFRHALLRDAAYSMQLTSRQRTLHALAVSAMEVLYKDDLEPHYGELAYHAEHALLDEKALHYLKLVADTSTRVYQNAQAVDYLTRALALIPQNDLHARFEIIYKRADIYYNTGDRSREDADLTILEEIAATLNDTRLLGRASVKRAYYFATTSENARVISSSERAIELARSVNDTETLSKAYNVLASAYVRLGNLDDGFKHAQDAIEYSRSVGNRYGEGSALTILGLIALEKLGPSKAHEYQTLALEIAREIGNRDLEASVLNNIANVIGLSQGDYSAARDSFEQSLVINQERGNLYAVGLCLTNIGWVDGILGNYEAALESYVRALAIAREVGNRTQEMYTLINLSAACVGKENPAVAIEWAQRAHDLSRKIGDRTGTAWAFFYLGYGYLLNGQLVRAKESFISSLQIREEVHVPVLIAESRAGIAQAAFELLDMDTAMTEVEKILIYMQENPNLEGAEEPLRIALTCFLVLKEKRDSRAESVLRNAIQLLDAQVSKLPSEDARRMYVENVPWRRALKKHYMDLS